MRNTTRCILLFARSPKQEALAKGFGRERTLFEFARRRIASAAALLGDVDLFVPRQRGGSFGERLADAFDQARALGYHQIVAVPIDTPALGIDEIADAFEALTTHEMVLGRSPDGGVYLLGLGSRAHTEELRRAVRWLTGSVAADLLRCFPAGAVLTRLITDLDHRSDLKRLRRDAVADAELGSLLVALRALPATNRFETSPPLRIPPARQCSGRAPPARPQI